MEDIWTSALLSELTNETCQRLGFRLPPEFVLHVNREAYARAVEHGLDRSKGFKKVGKALETASKHLQDTETRWARNGQEMTGWWWDKLSTAYEMYWNLMNSSTGYFLETLKQNGIELPAGPDGTPA